MFRVSCCHSRAICIGPLRETVCVSHSSEFAVSAVLDCPIAGCKIGSRLHAAPVYGGGGGGVYLALAINESRGDGVYRATFLARVPADRAVDTCLTIKAV